MEEGGGRREGKSGRTAAKAIWPMRRKMETRRERSSIVDG